MYIITVLGLITKSNRVLMI